jgi:hypothetical protein
VIGDAPTYSTYIDSYAQSDYTTRNESYAQKRFQGKTYDSYGKESYGEVQGHTKQQGIFLLGFT